jgi:hypothetical protein
MRNALLALLAFGMPIGGMAADAEPARARERREAPATSGSTSRERLTGLQDQRQAV